MAHLKNDGAINSGGCIASLSCGIAHSALQMGLLQVGMGLTLAGCVPVILFCGTQPLWGRPSLASLPAPSHHLTRVGAPGRQGPACPG